METNYRFSQQVNQYFGECLPCTAAVFNHYVDDPKVAWKIRTRQEVEAAISRAASLDVYTETNEFKQFCRRKASERGFDSLTTAEKLLQWVNSLKASLPCFIFAVSGFKPVPKVDKDGNPVLDKNGQQLMFRRRKLAGIESMSGLFMFDGDHLPFDPREVHERAMAAGFPWEVRLSHKTSSGNGIRLVCEARTEIGNIADNQICMARELGLMGVVGTTGKPVCDDSCIDATRISYCPRREDILYIDETHLFNI